MPINTAIDSPNVTEQTRSGEFYRPDVDILELADELLVQADVPGARPDDIDVNFEDGALTIYAKVAERPLIHPRRHLSHPPHRIDPGRCDRDDGRELSYVEHPNVRGSSALPRGTRSVSDPDR